MKEILGAGMLAAVGLCGVRAEEIDREVDEQSVNGGDWCFTIPADVAVLIDDPEARWLQRLEIGGYAHFQSAFVDGRSAGQDFWYGRGSDWRRVRAKGKAKLFGVLELVAYPTIVEDEGREGGGVEVDYFSIFMAWAKLDLGKVWKPSWLDGWSVAYGKRKLVELNEEVDTSINVIPTVERSSFSAQLAPFRAGTGTTGGWIEGTKGENSFSLGLFTTDSSKEFGDWQDGTVLVGGWQYDFAKCWEVDAAVVALGGGWQDVKGVDEVYSLWEWILTPWMRVENGRWGWRLSGAVGNNEGPDSVTGGAFYGMTVLPTWWLVDGRLQAVGRYSVMGSEAPLGVGMSTRYAREAGGSTNEGIPLLGRGRGDFHESFYAGLSWTICPKRWTMLCGLEWERLKSRDLSVYQGVTGWFTTRVIF